MQDAPRMSPSKETMGEILPEKDFNDLYVKVKEEGLPYFARINSTNEVEIYLVFESIESFSESTNDISSIEFKIYKQSLLAVIWTISDPKNPLGFPLSFDCQNDQERWMALQMGRQPFTKIHYLLYTESQLIHIYSEAITFSLEERDRVEELINLLMTGNTTDEPIQTISATSLSDSFLQETGVAYVFEYTRMLSTSSGEEASALLMNTLYQSLIVMHRHARSEVRESSCTIWVKEEESFLKIYITPSLEHLFEVVHYSDDEANPFTKFLLAIPEFLATEESSPLGEGAIPIFRFDHGKLYHLELDESITEKLANLFEIVNSIETTQNPYLPKT